jgi:hypothetical protein
MARSCNGILLGIPVYNEQAYVTRVLGEVRDYADCVLVIDDGSTDDTPLLLAQQRVEVIRHAENRGYGRSMQDMLRCRRLRLADHHGLRRAARTGRHPLVHRCHRARGIRRDLRQPVPAAESGRGGRGRLAAGGSPGHQRDHHRRAQLPPGSGADRRVLRVQGVPRLGLRIYHDPSRSFGGPLDNPTSRLDHYRGTMHREIDRCAAKLPSAATVGLHEPACTEVMRAPAVRAER